MPSCSKAPWGLSVLVRVAGIFTGIAISPSPSLRQCPYRYAIRAGRNLPDKEFRFYQVIDFSIDSVLSPCSHRRLHVAMQNRLYLRRCRDVRRIVCEDSNYLPLGFLAIHGFNNARYFDQATCRQMTAALDQPQTLYKPTSLVAFPI